MASIGFCLKEGFSTKDTFKLYLSWFLPFAPVFIFWFHHAYQEYLINRYNYADERDKIEQTIYELYNTDSFEKLKDIGEKAINFQIENNINNRHKRGIKKIIEMIFSFKGKNTTIWNFENFFFFSLLSFAWLIIILLKFN